MASATTVVLALFIRSARWEQTAMTVVPVRRINELCRKVSLGSAFVQTTVQQRTTISVKMVHLEPLGVRVL